MLTLNELLAKKRELYNEWYQTYSPEVNRQLKNVKRQIRFLVDLEHDSQNAKMRMRLRTL